MDIRGMYPRRFSLFKSELVLIIFFLLALLAESELLKDIYAVAPTPREYFAGCVKWKRHFLGYGLFLLLYAIWLLFDAGFAHFLGNNLVVAFVPVFSPLGPPLLAQQITVFNALNDIDEKP
jgi:hypothetical protein